jgi:hypothetical protein
MALATPPVVDLALTSISTFPYLVIQTDRTDMVVIIIMYVYSLRVGELGFPTLLSIWLLGTYNSYRRGCFLLPHHHHSPSLEVWEGRDVSFLSNHTTITLPHSKCEMEGILSNHISTSPSLEMRDGEGVFQSQSNIATTKTFPPSLETEGGCFPTTLPPLAPPPPSLKNVRRRGVFSNHPSLTWNTRWNTVAMAVFYIFCLSFLFSHLGTVELASGHVFLRIFIFLYFWVG